MQKMVKHSGGQLAEYVRLPESVGEAMARLPELSQRVLLVAAAMAVKEERHDVTISVSDAISAAGGSKKLYEAAYRAVSSAVGTGWVIEEDKEEEYALISSIVSRATIKDGKISLSFTEDGFAALRDVRSRYALIHLKNIRRLRGSARIGLYLLLAQWDSVGEYRLRMMMVEEIFGKYFTSRRAATFRDTVALPLSENINSIFASEHLDYKMQVAVEGRGKNALFIFSWPPNALREAAGDELPGMPGLSPEDEIYASAEAAVRSAGVGDVKIAQRLRLVKPESARRLVMQGLESGKTGGALRDWLTASLYEVKEKEDLEETRVSKEKAEVAAERRREDAEEEIRQLASAAAYPSPEYDQYEAWLESQNEMVLELPDGTRRDLWAREKVLQKEDVPQAQ